MRYVSAAIAVISGFIVLLGYLLPLDALTQLRLMLTDWAVILGGVAVLVGVLNLLTVHLDKIRRREKNSVYGILLVTSLILTALVGIGGDLFGVGADLMRFAMDAIIIPVEASLMAILAVTLVYASIRLLRRRAEAMTILFLIVTILFLIAVMPKPIDPSLSDQIGQPIVGFLSMFSNGGARGLLIGIALGTLLTGLRVLFGIDRPYGDN